jgi:predicted nucleic acid-binding protein
MYRYLRDTNVVSEIQKPYENSPEAHDFLYRLSPEQMWVSTIALGEIVFGYERLEEGKKKRFITDGFQTAVLPLFEGRMLSPDYPVAERWGQLRAAHPRTLPYLDSLIAATALVHDLTLVTRNTTDFADINGLHLLNPWDPPPP